MAKKCVICKKEIEEEYEKLQGTIVNVKEDNKNKFVFICSDCQKQDDWIEKAKVKAA